jgi:GTP-binding protein
VAIAAATGEGLDHLRERLATLLPDADELAAPPEPAGVVVHRIDPLAEGFAVEREDGAYRVRGRRIERLAAQTNFDNEESAERFQRDLARLGIEEALREQGVGAGDVVRIGRIELEWEAAPWEGR